MVAAALLKREDPPEARLEVRCACTMLGRWKDLELERGSVRILKCRIRASWSTLPASDFAFVPGIPWRSTGLPCFTKVKL